VSQSRSIVISLPPEIDIANAEQVRDDLLDGIDQGYAVVVADMNSTSFCDCAGVAALLSAGSYAARRGAQLRVVARARSVLRMFELTGMQLRLPVYRNSADALEGPDTGTSLQGGASVLVVSPVTELWCPVSYLRQSDAAECAPPPDQRQCPLPSCWCSATAR
jgi:anti-anti-sigma factor